MTGMDISGPVATVGVHRSVLSLTLQFWERLFKILDVRGQGGHRAMRGKGRVSVALSICGFVLQGS